MLLFKIEINKKYQFNKYKKVHNWDVFFYSFSFLFGTYYSTGL